MERKVFPGFSISMKSLLPRVEQFHTYSAMVHLGCRSVEGTLQANTIWFDDFPGEKSSGPSQIPVSLIQFRAYEKKRLEELFARWTWEPISGNQKNSSFLNLEDGWTVNRVEPTF